MSSILRNLKTTWACKSYHNWSSSSSGFSFCVPEVYSHHDLVSSLPFQGAVGSGKRNINNMKKANIIWKGSGM
jgi:hypothetical protein